MSDTHFVSVRQPNGHIRLGRVTVFLGSNGTGKTRLLEELRERASNTFPGRTVVYIEGGRAIQLVDDLAIDKNNFTTYRTIDSTRKSHHGKLGSRLSSRVFDALMLLDKLAQESKIAHSDAVTEWHNDGAVGTPPRLADLPLDRVFALFNEVFPRIRLTYDPNNRRMKCRKGDASYGPTKLSDGEKQCFSVLADIVAAAAEVSLIVVDEPELNLHPQLANRLWDTVESEFPQAIFVYATHSISFAMRRSVDAVHVLSDATPAVCEVASAADVDRAELAQLLGSIPAILTTGAALLTEGDEKSFDAVFYRWLLPSFDFEPVPLGGANDVLAVTRRRGVWDRVAGAFRLVGVVDRDFKPDSEVVDVGSTCVLLDLHEAESYLCIPELAAKLSERIGTEETPLTPADVDALIQRELEDQILQIVARRAFCRLTINVGVSARRRVLGEVRELESLRAVIVSEAKAASEFATGAVAQNAVLEIVDQEHQRCSEVLASGDVLQKLRLVPGKQILHRLCRRMGCKSPDAAARAAAKHIAPDEIAAVTCLQAKLLTAFAAQAGS